MPWETFADIIVCFQRGFTDAVCACVVSRRKHGVQSTLTGVVMRGGGSCEHIETRRFFTNFSAIIQMYMNYDSCTHTDRYKILHMTKLCCRGMRKILLRYRLNSRKGTAANWNFELWWKIVNGSQSKMAYVLQSIYDNVKCLIDKESALGFLNYLRAPKWSNHETDVESEI